jgi:hypothetical protein
MAGEDLLYKMSFSGQDAKVFAYHTYYSVDSSGTPVQGVAAFEVDALQTISISVFREKIPVRALGFSNVIGHTRGPRSLSGSLIFTALHDHPLKQLFKKYDYDFSYDVERNGKPWSDIEWTYIYPDVIPPFNLLVNYKNELGYSAMMHILGVDIINDGIVTSVEDMITENTMQYRARDMHVFKAEVGANSEPIDQSNVVDVIETLLNFDSYFAGFGTPIEIPEATSGSFDRRVKSSNPIGFSGKTTTQRNSFRE